MSKLRIGYSPLSQDLNSAGDRRRLVFWAKNRGHTLITNLKQKVDVIVAGENSDFNSSVFTESTAPIIFYLVDAYLSPLNPIDDLARGIGKKISGQITGVIRPFSHHIREFCRRSNAVICSSIEQQEVIQKLNRNCHVILDSHEEIPFSKFSMLSHEPSSVKRILWEGQPATIRGVN